MAIDDRTSNLDLPLPNVKNKMADDCARLRTALNDLDGIVQQIETAAQNAGTVAVTAAEAVAEAMSKAADAIRGRQQRGLPPPRQRLKSRPMPNRQLMPQRQLRRARPRQRARPNQRLTRQNSTASEANTTAQAAQTVANAAVPKSGARGHWPETRLLWSQLVIRPLPRPARIA